MTTCSKADNFRAKGEAWIQANPKVWRFMKKKAREAARNKMKFNINQVRVANKTDYLFAYKAIIKFLTSKVKEVEDDCKAELIEEFNQNGTDRKRSTLFGDKAGYMTVIKQEPEPSHKVFKVLDLQAVCEWFEGEQPDTTGFARAQIVDFAKWHFEATGEVPEGCSMVDTEPIEAGVKDVRLVVKDDIVIPILRDNPQLMGEVSQLLLSDGSE